MEIVTFPALVVTAEPPPEDAPGPSTAAEVPLSRIFVADDSSYCTSLESACGL